MTPNRTSIDGFKLFLLSSNKELQVVCRAADSINKVQARYSEKQKLSCNNVLSVGCLLYVIFEIIEQPHFCASLKKVLGEMTRKNMQESMHSAE